MKRSLEGNPVLLAYLFLTGTALCWGANAIFGKLAVGEVSPMMVVLGRWIGVVLLCAIFLRRTLRDNWAALRPRLPYIIAMGGLGFTVFNLLFYIAAHSTSAVNIGILQGSIPVFVLMGAILVFRERISAMQGVGVLVTVVGVLLVASSGQWDRLASLAFNMGDVFMLAACFLYAGYTVGLRNRPKVAPLALFAAMAVAALVISVPFAIGEAILGEAVLPTPTGWVVLLGITLFPSFIAQIFFIQGVDRLGPSRAGVFVNLVPIFASIMAVAFLGERFENYHLLALVLVLFGIFLSERFKRVR